MLAKLQRNSERKLSTQADQAKGRKNNQNLRREEETQMHDG
jgi:hypothetical protein